MSNHNKTLSQIFSFLSLSFLIIIACNSDEVISGPNEEIVDQVSNEDSQNDATSDNTSSDNNNNNPQISSEDDYLEAIKYSATFVRIGSSIFGLRS